jgi:uncharacterized protein CbrC (UPF0167 family)
MRGLTHGVPGLEVNGYDTATNEDDWKQVRIPSDRLLELVRTPGYITWQGERWLMCCGGPMTYLGEWGQVDFSQHAIDGDGPALFRQLTLGSEWRGWSWDDLTGSFRGVIYAFHCKSCDNKRLSWDCD